MNVKKVLLVGVALGALSATAAQAQDTTANQDGQTAADAAGQPGAAEDDQAIVVTGIRASLQSAQARKRNADQIVDSIVAEDIGKLPDVNTTEALQRISGVQVARDRGEGGAVAIRGLSQVLTTVNGREVVTIAAPGGGAGTRGFNLQDYPAELLAGIDVYKTPSANLIEGGIGGLIDLRTRRPLDFKGFFASGSVIGRYSDLRDKFSPQVSGLVSTRWDAGGGEMGLLLSGVYQVRDYRSDIIGVGNPMARNASNFAACSTANPCAAGTALSLPNGTFEPLIVAKRTRIGADGMFQWKPTPDLEFYVQGSYQRFKDSADQWGQNKQVGGAVPTAVTTFPGTTDVATATYKNLVVTTFSAARDVIDENQQYAVGGIYKTGRAKLSGEFAYQKSHNELYYTEIDLRTTVPTAQFDITGKTPRFALSGVDFTQLSNYQLGAASRNENYVDGDHYSAKLDAEVEIDSPFLSAFDVGFRWADFSIDFTPVRYSDSSKVGQPAGAFTSLFGPARYWGDGYFNRKDLAANFLTVDNQALRNDFPGALATLGISSRPTVSTIGIYSQDEETRAAYAMAKFKVEGGVSLDGNVGVRVVATDLTVTGNQPVFTRNPATGAFTQTGLAPIDLHNHYVSALPSANVRVGLTDDFQLRFAAGKTITRPNFSQLAPSLTLVPGQGNGSSGNPNLKPLTANQLDASAEYYLSRSTYLYAAGFYRRVKNFILTTATPGVEIGDIVYTITRPENLDKGSIKGFELGGQTFFDFLPAPFDGFGVQANYTYVKSDTPSTVAGAIVRTPLPNLSKHSFNLIGLYEKGPISARVAYNFRSKFLSGVFAGGTLGTLPVYRKGYGWLDASLNIDVTRQFSLTFEGTNLLRTREHQFYDVLTRPGNFSIDDRQFLVGVRFKL
jgi:TonB-dependent receptor